MPIPIITGFNVLDNTPIDGRYLVADNAERDLIDVNSLYVGLQVFNQAISKVEVLTTLDVNDTANNVWVVLEDSTSGNPRYVTVTGDSGTHTTQSASGVIDVLGGDGITTVVTNDNGDSVVTINLDTPSTTFLPEPSFAGTTQTAIGSGAAITFPVVVTDNNYSDITYVINSVTLDAQSSSNQFSTAAITPSGNTFSTTATGTGSATASYTVNLTASYPDATPLTADYDLDLILDEAPPVFYTRVTGSVTSPLTVEADYDLTDTNKWSVSNNGLPPSVFFNRPVGTSSGGWTVMLGIADADNVDAQASFDDGDTIPDVFPMTGDSSAITPSGYKIYSFPLSALRPLVTIDITPTT